MERKKLLLLTLLGTVPFLSPLASFADVEKVCSCNQLGSDYWCGEGDTPDKAREELAKNIYTSVDSYSSKVIKGENGRYTGKFNQKTFISTTAIIGNLETNGCNGTYVAYIRKDKYKELIRNSFETELTKLDTANNIDELLKIRKKLSTLYTVARRILADVGEDEYKDAVSRINEKINSLKVNDIKNFVKTVFAEIMEIALKIREGKEDYSKFSSRVDEIIEQLRKELRKYKNCKLCESTIEKTIEELLKLKTSVYENLPGTIKIAVVKGDGTVYIDGEIKDKITDNQEKSHVVKVEGHGDYETREFKVRLKKGKTIIKEVRLWKLNKVFHKGVKLGYRTPYNVFFASYQKFYSLKTPLFKPFTGISLGYSHDRYGFETEATVGVKIYRKNEEEFLFMVRNNLLSFSLGASLGYYGFNDKDDKSYWFLRPFVSTELDFNYYFGIELKGFYQKILDKDDGFEHDSFGISSSLNFYF